MIKLFEYLENTITKLNIIKELSELINQFNKDILTKEECLKQMKNIIKQSNLKWLLDSLKDINEPYLYLKTFKDFQ